MKLNKIKTHVLEKCYAIAPLTYQGKQHIIVAAEKINKCLLFDPHGNLEDTIWEEPGGTMSMVQVPRSDGVFLATQKFYSTNDSIEAKIVLVSPGGMNGWEVRTIAKIPFVHRFDILTRNGVDYLIACTFKSAQEHKDDWSTPGQILVCELPGVLDEYNETHLLGMKCIKKGLLKNHGYCRSEDKQGMCALVAAENGIFRVIPPDEKNGEWVVEQLTYEPASDMAVVDFNGDGVDELIAIAPFHGDEIKIYQLSDGVYKKAYQYKYPIAFGHAIWAGELYGKPASIIGCRKGNREILGFTYENGYCAEVLEMCAGSANVMHYRRDGVECMVAANREINEIAFYEIES